MKRASHSSVAPALPMHGPLGQWEPTFTNVIPHEELTRVLSDFLFAHIVGTDAHGTGAAGSIPSSQGQLEIEAKIGRIINRSTNERLQLPIKTETVLAEGIDVAFESFMTVVWVQLHLYALLLSDKFLDHRRNMRVSTTSSTKASSSHVPRQAQMPSNHV